jgi:hypothetical protein
MKDPRDLRAQAILWRRQANTQTPVVAAALTLAAHQLDQQAERLEAAHRAAAAFYPGDRAAEPARGLRPA